MKNCNLGIDIEIEDDNGQKVLDILMKHPSQTSQEITALIYGKLIITIVMICFNLILSKRLLVHKNKNTFLKI